MDKNKKETRVPIPEPARGGGSLKPNGYIALSDDYFSSGCHDSLPIQVQHAMRMVWNDFDAKANIGKLSDAWNNSKLIDANGGQYTQGIIGKIGQKSFLTHYFSGGIATKNLTSRKGSFTAEQYQQYITFS